LALAWIGAMSLEFGVKDWLRAHPLAYLFSHMLVMPFLALVAISFAVPDTEAFFSARVAIVLGLAFVAGLSLEIGRKVWAPAEEREGVETYSKLWGAATAAIAWLAAASAALILGAVAAGPRLPILLTAGVLILIGAMAALRFIGHTDVSRAGQLRAVVVLGVAAAYGLAIAGAMLP
jgi:4-hydroxybenzoate polyprenyltransferase